MHLLPVTGGGSSRHMCAASQSAGAAIIIITPASLDRPGQSAVRPYAADWHRAGATGQLFRPLKAPKLMYPVSEAQEAQTHTLALLNYLLLLL